MRCAHSAFFADAHARHAFCARRAQREHIALHLPGAQCAGSDDEEGTRGLCRLLRASHNDPVTCRQLTELYKTRSLYTLREESDVQHVMRVYSGRPLVALIAVPGLSVVREYLSDAAGGVRCREYTFDLHTGKAHLAEVPERETIALSWQVRRDSLVEAVKEVLQRALKGGALPLAFNDGAACPPRAAEAAPPPPKPCAPTAADKARRRRRVLSDDDDEPQRARDDAQHEAGFVCSSSDESECDSSEEEDDDDDEYGFAMDDEAEEVAAGHEEMSGEDSASDGDGVSIGCSDSDDSTSSDEEGYAERDDSGSSSSSSSSSSDEMDVSDSGCDDGSSSSSSEEDDG